MVEVTADATTGNSSFHCPLPKAPLSRGALFFAIWRISQLNVAGSINQSINPAAAQYKLVR